MSAKLEKKIPVTGLYVKLSRAEVSLQLNGLVKSGGRPGMLLEIDYQGIDMFQFTCAFLENTPRYKEDWEPQI